MPIPHETGMMSSHQDIFYYSGHWDAWSRLLLRGGEKQGFLKEIAIGISPVKGQTRNCHLHLIRTESIRVYNNVNHHVNDRYTHVLPQGVYDTVKDLIGYGRLKRLMDYDYLQALDLDKLLEIDRIVPFSEVKLSEPFVGSLSERLSQYPEFYQIPRKKS